MIAEDLKKEEILMQAWREAINKIYQIKLFK